jgi:hypothetical protein
MTSRAQGILPLAGCLALLLTCAAPAGAQEKTTIYKIITPEQIEQILKDMNITFKKSQPPNLKEDYDYDFDRNNYRYRFTLSKGKLLWLSVAFPKATLEQINGWNVNAKFTRAVLDRVGDREVAFVESQLDANGGVTVDMIMQFIRRFDDDVPRFDQHLKKN